MWNKLSLSVVIMTLFAGGLCWPQFFRDYNEKDRQTLGEAYYLAGSQYVKVGKTELGREYQKLARQIYPQLEPSKIQDEKLPSADELLAQGMAKWIGAPETGTEGLPKSFFLRFMGAFLEEDAAQVAAFLDGSVYLSAQNREMAREEAATAFEELFSNISLAGVEPSALYDLDSVVIVKAPDAARDKWGDAYILRVNAKMDFSSQLDFWEMNQQYFVHRVNGAWYIMSIGQEPPPLSWEPKSAPAEPAAAPAAVKAPDKEIMDAFEGCISAFLKKNLDSTLSFISDTLIMVRMRQTVSREELKTTFQGYFENMSFGDSGYSDAIDGDSIFVEPTKDFTEEGRGPVYALSVKARDDLSDKIPFWTTYQRYYFREESGEWKVFAIF